MFPDPRDAQLVVHHLSLLERSRYYGKFIMSLPFGTAAKIVFWTVLLNQRRAISIAITLDGWRGSRLWRLPRVNPLP